jgi:hypothetical protein
MARMTTAIATNSPVAQLLSLSSAYGASTGFMEELRDDWEGLVHAAHRFSEGAVELSALSACELPGLSAMLQREGVPTFFAHVTVHGPAKGDWGSDASLATRLAALPAGVEGIVLHPETLMEPACFSAVGSRLLLENMDPTKDDGRTVEELGRYFEELPQAGLCLDIAHAWLMDPSLALAHALLDAFGDRLREVHVSSIMPDGRHIPLRLADAVKFVPVLQRCRDVPWIFEAPLES